MLQFNRLAFLNIHIPLILQTSIFLFILFFTFFLSFDGYIIVCIDKFLIFSLIFSIIITLNISQNFINHIKVLM
jgi:hypothetical protein